MSQNLAVNDIIVSEVICWDPPEQQIAVSRMYWFVSAIAGGAGPVTFSDVAATLDANWGVTWVALIYNDAIYYGTRARRANPPNNDQWAFNTNGQAPGIAGAVALPTQTCGLLKRGSGTIGKHGQGRIYLPFPSATDNVLSGKPSAGYLANANALGAFLLVAMPVPGAGGAVAQLEPCLYDKVSTAKTLTTTAAAQLAWATQKRRGAYGRTNKLPF